MAGRAASAVGRSLAKVSNVVGRLLVCLELKILA